MHDKERRSNKREKMKRNKFFPFKKTRKIKFSSEEEAVKHAKVTTAAYWGLFWGWIVASLIFIIALLIVMSQPFFQQDIDTHLLRSSFIIVAQSWQDDKVVQDLSYLCSLKESDVDRVDCAYRFIADNMEVGYHDEGTNRLNKPEEIFSKPSVCRDSAVLFRAVLNNLNITNDFVQEPGHIYNVVYLADWTCYIDVVNDDYECVQN